MKRAAMWICGLAVLAVGIYEFAPDGSSDEGVPAGIRADVRDQIAKLRSRRAARRCEAAEELGRLRAGEAGAYLAGLLTDEADAMGLAERAMQAMVFGSRAKPVWSCAERALLALGPEATMALIDMAGSTQRARYRATRILSLSDDPRASEYLSQRLRDPDAAIRRDALVGVAQHERPERVESIRSALRDPGAEVRALALGYAVKIQEDWVESELRALQLDPDPTVRARAQDVLRARSRERMRE